MLAIANLSLAFTVGNHVTGTSHGTGSRHVLQIEKEEM